MAAQGNATNYQYLIRQLTGTGPAPSNGTTRPKIYQALTRCISSMTKEPQAFQHLLDALFKFQFLAERDEIDAYTQFLVHLVSSNTVYVLPTLQTLVRSLCRPQQLPPLASAAATSVIAIKSASSAQDDEKRIQQRFDVVHATLQRVLKLVPTAANVIFPVLCEHFPHKRLETPFQVAYVSNLLKLSTYLPGIQERLFGLLTDQLVAIDVEIKLDENEEDIFTMDDFLDDELLPPDAGTGVDEMADKLDQMMLVVFEHVAKSVSNGGAQTNPTSENGKLDAPKAALVFKSLLKVFEHSILNTHRSKYPQFLLFFVCAMDPQFQDVFISQLLSASLDAQTPPVTRYSCAVYLASFLARAKYISVSYLEKALYHLMKWMHDQMDIYDTLHPVADADSAPTSPPPSTESFQESIFVSSLQTVCYMLCFRGLEIAQSPNGYEFLRTLGWERLVHTPATGYCPLAYCQQTVATEFLNFAETFDLVSDDCIERVDQAMQAIHTSGLKKGKSMERSNAPKALNNSVGAPRQPLETFFPFDPYLLRRSFKYIGPLYLYWKHADPNSSENCDALHAVKAMIHELQEEEEDDEDDEDDDEEEGDDEDDVSMSGNSFRAESSFKDTMMATSVGSSYDGGEPLDSETVFQRNSRKRQHSRSMFAPSPALSASSPPSQLPPLGTANAFTLGGDWEQDDDDGF